MISIITASYNYEKYISQTIESVIAQSYDDWELIIVDDGSKDNSVEIINSYCKKDSRVKLFTHENGCNKGLVETVKLGISKACGEHIAFLESDDLWENDNLLHKIQAIKKSPNAAFYLNDIQMIGDEKIINNSLQYFYNQKKLLLQTCFDLKEFLRNNYVPTFSSIMISKEKLSKLDFNAPSKPNLDWYLWVQLLQINSEIVYIPFKDTIWRIHSDSYISKRDNTEIRNFFAKIHELILKNHLHDNLYNKSKFLHSTKIEKLCRSFVLNFDKKLMKLYPQTIKVRILYPQQDDKKPLLSICIPTYNRANLLEKTVKNLTSQDFFKNTNSVEIIISDNCSTDNTQEVGLKLQNLYPDKVFYYRNETNLYDKNFELALSKGKGQYLKLCNDTLTFHSLALEKMCNDISLFIQNKPVLFFSGAVHSDNHKYILSDNLNEFLMNASYGITAIGSFGIWKSDFDEITDFSKNSDKLLTQVDILLKELEKKKNSVIISENYFSNISFRKKGGYNIAHVFGQNYFDYLSEYVHKNLLSKKVYENEKKNMLFHHIIPFYFDFKNMYNFNKDGYFKYLTKYYYHNLYFYFSFFKIFEKTVKKYFHQRRIQKEARRGEHNIVWKDWNSHNETTVSKNSDINRIFVGNYSYGNINMYHSGEGAEILQIGHFCSIAPEVTFLLASEHGYKSISTYPFKVKFFNQQNEAGSKGSIYVEDDVWIGYGATIFSGVKIGQGAIIGAGSIVTKDVPPYAIVAGNPAKILKYRFENTIIEKLLQFNYSFLSKEQILNLKNELYSDLSIENVDEIINKITKM